MEAEEILGKRIAVWWPKYRKWYTGRVTRQGRKRTEFEVLFDDELDEEYYIPLLGKHADKWMVEEDLDNLEGRSVTTDDLMDLVY